MTRTLFHRWKYAFLVSTFFSIGFLSGLYYWQLFVEHQCASSTPEPDVAESASFYPHFQYRTMRTCRNERSNIFLTIAVLSSFERLNEYLPAILETWALTTTIEIEVIIFIEETSTGSEDFLERLFHDLAAQIPSCLFIVKLKHVENSYPPQKKSFYAMKFLHTFYRQRTSWVLRLDDNAYVNIPQLLPWLKSIDHQQALYIGQGGTGRRDGPAVHFPPGKYFCMGGSGVILSQQTLSQLGPWLDHCYTRELLTKHEDVELGRCILAHVQVGCTNAYDSKILFYHHYGPGYAFGDDFTPAIISQAFILHPIKIRTIFRQLYSFSVRQRQARTPHASHWDLSRHRDFVTFLGSREIDLERDIQFQLVDARWRVYIETTAQSYLEHLKKVWYHRSSNWTVLNAKALFGYHRVTSKAGLELIVEVLLNVRTVGTSPPQPLFVRKRVYIRRALVSRNRLEYREVSNLDDESPLNLIVVSNQKDEALLRFVRNFESQILTSPDRQRFFTLTILYFPQNNSAIETLRQLTVRYPSVVRLSIINNTQQTYNRGLGRQLASNAFTSQQLLFFLDVDLVVTGSALVNTRRLIVHLLSISTCAVYFPIIYSVFSDMFNDTHPQIDTVHGDAGLFSIYGFGNVAVRKGDLDRIGGWETNNHDWGVEDVNLFQRFVNKSAECYVFRAVEPGLRHHYHKKACNGIQNLVRQKMCYDAEASLLGSQVNMVNYVFVNRLVNNEE